MEMKLRVENIERFEVEMPIEVYTCLLRNRFEYGRVEHICREDSIITIHVDVKIDIEDLTHIHIKPVKLYGCEIIK